MKRQEKRLNTIIWFQIIWFIQKVNVNENFQDTNYRNNIKEKKENYRLKILKKYTMEIVK